jgi:2-(1,2-epoxy-1,2-dihydrophenyl)acetyl-CoA isomerase
MPCADGRARRTATPVASLGNSAIPFLEPLMSENHFILMDVQDHIATITLNRPERLNALGQTMREDLLAAILRARDETDIRVLLITGAGRAFCSGGDVKEMSDRVASGATSRRELEIWPVRDRILAEMRGMPKPVIAVVNGVAAGAGCNLALGCDMRIASDRAGFTQAFVKRGLHPDWGGTYFMPRMLGIPRAFEFILSGDVISAQQALDWGLVNRVVPQAGLKDAALEWARKFAAGPPVVYALAKRAIYRNLDADLTSALEYEAYAQRVVWTTEDAAEGIRAFVEKRPPQFTGK